MRDPIFQNQNAIAASWRAQIAAAVRERESLRQGGVSGSRIGALTRRINDMEAQLAKLMALGASYD